MSVIQILGRGRLYQKQKRLLIRGLFLENVNRFLPRFLEARQAEISQAQLQSHIQILRLQLFGLAKKRERSRQPALLEAHQPQARNGNGMLRIEPHDVHVLDLRPFVVSGLKITIRARQVAILPGLVRTTGATHCD